MIDDLRLQSLSESERKVFNIIQSHRAVTLPQIIAIGLLPPNVVTRAVAVLIQHDLVQVEDEAPPPIEEDAELKLVAAAV